MNYYSLKTYPFLSRFRRSHDEMVKEVKALLDLPPSGGAGNWTPWPEMNLYDHNAKPDWKIFPFCGFGVTIKENCDRCPTISNLLQKIPGLKTALISRMGPSMYLKPHQGWASHSNFVLRCHYSLIVPEGCGLIVNDEVRVHEEGKWIIFDDSKMHSAFNNSTQDRYVLIIDIERPADVPMGTSAEPNSDELLALIEEYAKRQKEYTENTVEDKIDYRNIFT